MIFDKAFYLPPTPERPETYSNKQETKVSFITTTTSIIFMIIRLDIYHIRN